MTRVKTDRKSLNFPLLLAALVLACSAFLYVLYLGRTADKADKPDKTGTSYETYAGGQIRFLKISGVHNVRDIGGWTTPDGKRVRYGLIIRGGELDGIHSTHIKAKGIEQLKSEGIKTEVDLRNSSEVAKADYPIKSFAEYNRYEIVSYMGVREDKELYKEAISKIITSVLEDKPVYVHCWGGADRTGTVIALIEGALGVSKEHVIEDYELTSYSSVGERRYGKGKDGKKFEELILYIENDFDGDTFGEKCTNLLTDLGIDAKDIEAFRAKMLE